jgi:hypothetical protein
VRSSSNEAFNCVIYFAALSMISKVLCNKQINKQIINTFNQIISKRAGKYVKKKNLTHTKLSPGSGSKKIRAIQRAPIKYYTD